MLSELFDWWVRQMHALLPLRFGQRDWATVDAVIVRTQDLGGTSPRIALARRTSRIETQFGSFLLDIKGVAGAHSAAGSHRTGKIILQISPALLLEREIVMPLATEADLGRVLGYEMDRITPFAATELFWTWRLERRDKVQSRLHLRLSIVRRIALKAVLDRLGDAGLVPDMLVTTAQDGTDRFIALRHEDASSPRQRKMVQGLTAVCGVLLLAVVAAPFVLNLRAIAEADAHIAALKPRVAQVEALRQRQAAENNGADVFAAEAMRTGSTLQALAALTDILPDDTWLSALSLRQRVLIFTGQSARAARLITALSADPMFHNPVFVTPVTRADSEGTDLFSIRTEFGV